jgi:hypothetical protein
MDAFSMAFIARKLLRRNATISHDPRAELMQLLANSPVPRDFDHIFKVYTIL